MSNKISAILIVLFGLFALVFAGLFVKTNYFDKQTLISVTGTGKVTASPTKATLTVSVLNASTSSLTAVSDNRRTVKDLVALSQKLGVANTEIVTAYPRVVPVDLGGGKLAYQAVNSLDLTIRNLSNFDSIVDQLYAIGAYSVSNIVFTTDSPDVLEKDAVNKAILGAKTKAVEMAKGLGKSVGRIVSVTSSATGDAGAVSGSNSAASTNTGSPSTIEISRQAQIVFELN